MILAASLAGAAWLTGGPVARLFEVLDCRGEEARVVGGAVRDALINRAVGEIDIATTALPEEVVRRADRAKIRSVPTGIDHGTVTLIVGLAVLALGVVEVTAREHFSGYRSHTTLLAAIPAVALGIGLVSIIGTDRRNRGPVLLAVALPVFALLVWFLRRRFQIARHARAVRARR